MPERSNLFASHWSNQWLTQKRVSELDTFVNLRLLVDAQTPVGERAARNMLQIDARFRGD